MGLPELSPSEYAKIVSGAWFAREVFSFFLKLRKQDQQHFYRPSEEWRIYCTEKFESISLEVSKVFHRIWDLEAKINHLEKSMKGKIK